jgi:hypothetical protein
MEAAHAIEIGCPAGIGTAKRADTYPRQGHDR